MCEPREILKVFVRGVGHSVTALTLLSFRILPDMLMMYPRKETVGICNLHFSPLIYSWFSKRHDIILLTWVTLLSREGEYIKISLM